MDVVSARASSPDGTPVKRHNSAASRRTVTATTSRPAHHVDTSTSAPTDEVGAVLGVDLKTDIKPPDRNGNKHLLTIVDYGSSFNRVYLLQMKDEAAKRILEFLPELERQYNVAVKVIRLDGGVSS